MGDLKEKIMEELNCETVFTIHIGNFNIPIARVYCHYMGYHGDFTCTVYIPDKRAEG